MRKDFLSALTVLFEDISVVSVLLNTEAYTSYELKNDCRKINENHKIIKIYDTILDYIIQMSCEIKELGDDELPRLKAETTGMLLILREIRVNFSELFEN